MQNDCQVAAGSFAPIPEHLFQLDRFSNMNYGRKPNGVGSNVVLPETAEDRSDVLGREGGADHGFAVLGDGTEQARLASR